MMLGVIYLRKKAALNERMREGMEGGDKEVSITS